MGRTLGCTKSGPKQGIDLGLPGFRTGHEEWPNRDRPNSQLCNPVNMKVQILYYFSTILNRFTLVVTGSAISKNGTV